MTSMHLYFPTEMVQNYIHRQAADNLHHLAGTNLQSSSWKSVSIKSSESLLGKYFWPEVVKTVPQNTEPAGSDWGLRMEPLRTKYWQNKRVVDTRLSLLSCTDYSARVYYYYCLQPMLKKCLHLCLQTELFLVHFLTFQDILRLLFFSCKIFRPKKKLKIKTT